MRRPGRSTSGAATLAIDGLAATAIMKQQYLAALSGGEINNGAVVIVQYDSSHFEMQSTSGNAATGGSGQTVMMSVPVVPFPFSQPTWFIGLSGIGTTGAVYDSTESNRRTPMPVGCTAGNFTASIETAQPSDGSLVLTMRQWTSGTAASTPLVLTFPSSAAAGTIEFDTTHTYTFSQRQYNDIMAMNNSPTAQSAYLVSVSFTCRSRGPQAPNVLRPAIGYRANLRTRLAKFADEEKSPPTENPHLQIDRDLAS
ncbi:MAG TPA: hypothetical protein VGL97_12655 [Bryobacteraceae bacterium]